ncbi:MAG TPA: lysine--tRNA ligase [Candidatus Aminicenantes bacterium]|nr:lysine--tRNA ligase [Candidatus Aminicenantes bacterium]HRY66065.1 lysine--tRNA ligase [Candidatus Aminicenantes bacterium]HRZ72886.1 lysine--tRNA ligase [Candidatus Aminicenantes bacterium]
MSPKNEPAELDQDVARRDKYRRLAEAGLPIFPYTAARTHDVSQAVEAFAGLTAEDLEARRQAVIVPGRIMSIRKMGKATFFHLSDGQRQLQAYIRADKAGAEAYERFGLLDLGDVVAVSGTLFKTRTGELTVLCDAVTFLAKCLHPLPEKWHGLQDVELRYRQRYLDLIMNPEVGRVFRLRGAILGYIRRFFDSRGYLEVETPMMHAVPGGALARPFQTHHNALDLDLYLRIAPELYLKRLVVGGLDKVYEINRSFRNEGLDAQHNPEFTMLEFYEAYKDYFDMMDMTEELLNGLAVDLLGAEDLPYGEETISFKRPFRRLKFLEACVHYSGLEPRRFEDRPGLIAFAAGLAPEKKVESYGKALDVVFDRFVKDHIVQPTFITNPPREISPLAKTSRDNPEEAERFELMVAGMELANAFSELTDPAEQRARFEDQARERSRGDDESHVVDLDYVEALEYGLPPTGGEGIGIDRLTMLLANQRTIREVILFPLLRPR